MHISHQGKIIALWSTFLLGLLFHTQLGLMPLFHGLSVTASNAQNMSEIAPIMWLMLAFFALPMAAIIATAFTEAKIYRNIHFGFTILYTILNFSHLGADLAVQPIAWYQIALMVILFGIGLLLNFVAWQWMKEHRRSHRTESVSA